MGIDFILDTNVALFLAKGMLAEPLPTGVFAVSFVTEIELLCFPNMSSFEQERLDAFLSKNSIIGVDLTIRQHAIRLRRDHGLKLPDALIAATAIAEGAILLTNDKALLKTPGLLCQSLQT